jgi:elongation factor G
LKTYDAKDIRNVLLVGHGGSGKTTLLEAMLFTAGSITRMGVVEDGNTVSDHDPDEQRKGISVSLAMAPIEWEGVKINVLDAPGYADFVGDLRSAILAADAVIVVVSAVDGVEVQTEAAWELAVEAGLPRAIFVNKLDRERADFPGTLAQLVSAFGNQVAPFELPIGAEHEFRGVADLLHEKADLYPSGPKAEESEWPDEIHLMADPAREKLIEAVAESDDDLIEEYLEVGTLPEEHIVSGAKDGFARARLAPVIVGSAAKAIGIDRLLDFIVEEFPSPIDRGSVVVHGKGGGETERSCDPDGPVCAFVFKTVSDPFVGHITMFRVFSGKVRPDSTLHNATQGTDERIGQLFTQKGKEHESVPEVAAGDIGAVAKLQHAHTGDTFSVKDDPTQVPTIPLPEPLLAYAIAPRTKGDEDKLATGLARLREEDPTLRVSRNEETHETVMHGMGEAHLEVMIERLKRKYGVDVTTAPAKIAYRETVRGKAKATGRHVKQSGGHGQYAVCEIELEPAARGEGFVYEDKIFGGAIPNQFIPSIEKGIVKTMAEGVLSGNPMVDVKVTLVDGKFHSVDSSDMAFQIAGSLALKEAVEQAGVMLLEPMVNLDVIVPDSYTGDIMGDLNAKRGKIAGMDQVGGGKQVIHATVPQAEVARYVIDLRSMTGGRGAFSMAFSHYEEMPQHLAQKVIDAYQQAREDAHKK